MTTTLTTPMIYDRVTEIALEPFHIDGFAGGGGASEGYERATGLPVDVALNHDREALAMHRVNHPLTRHLREDIRRTAWRTISGGRQVTSAWFSPDCKDFSKAKGGKPKSKRIRGLAWTVIHMINELGPLAPLVIFMENVEEFAEWCPLLKDGTRNRRLLRWFFKCFVGALRRRGYVVEWRELRACERSGAPTIRKRLYIIARRDGRPITWPAEQPEAKRRVAADILDFSLPCPSIFMTRRQARSYSRRTGIKIQRPLARASLKRIADGVGRYVIGAKDPFLVVVNNTRNPATGAGDPVKTVASGGNLGVIVPVVAAQQHGGSSRPATAPLHTIAASPKDQNQLLSCVLARTAHGERCSKGRKRGRGAHRVTEPVASVMASNDLALSSVFLAQQNFGDTPAYSPADPVRTVVAGGGHESLVGCFLAQHNGGMVGHDCREPVSTVNAKGANQALVAVGYAKYYGNEKEGQSVRDSIGTVTTKERFGLFAAQLEVPVLTPELATQARKVAQFLRRHGVKVEGEFAMCGEFVIVDIGMRMLTARELYRAQGFTDDYIIDRGIDEDGTEIRLTKTAQVRMCGNSVCPPMAEALIRANLPEYALQEVAA